MIRLKHLLTEQFGRIDSELILATTLVLEAGGEGSNGMLAVAHVINNRAKENHNAWGTNPVKQVLQPYQFSMWNDYTAGSEKWGDVLKRAQARTDQWSYALPLAKQLRVGSISSKDITLGATFYYNPKTANKDSLGFTKHPDYVQTKTIGRHVFGTLIDNPSDTKKQAAVKQSTNINKSTTHTVKSGDTLSELAEKYEITIQQLKQINGLTSDNIRIGQKLYVQLTKPVPNKKPVPTTLKQTIKDNPWDDMF